MKVKMILPALTKTNSPFWRSIKYSLFPPLGLATLAGYLKPDDEVTIQSEHVEALDLDDDPDLVAIQVYIPSAYRAYEIADYYRQRGTHVALGGIHVTSTPEEAAQHADTIFIGPGEDTWPVFLDDFRAGRPGKVYRSQGGLPMAWSLRAVQLKSVTNGQDLRFILQRGCKLTQRGDRRCFKQHVR